MSGSRIPSVLQERLGAHASLGLVELLDTEESAWSGKVLKVAENRFERRLAEVGSGLRTELHDGLMAIRQELATTRVELLKWSFLFWVGQVAVTMGMLAFMLRGR